MKIYLTVLFNLLVIINPVFSQSNNDSLDVTFFEEFKTFFLQNDSSRISDLEKTNRLYKKLESIIKLNPKNHYSADFISWGKNFDTLQINYLFKLLDSTLQVLYKSEILNVKKRTQFAIGKLSPTLIFKDSLNYLLNIDELKGKVIFIDLWASTCRPCRSEMPQLKILHEKYKDQGFVVIGVSVDENKNDWLRAIAHDGQSWSQYCELKPWLQNSMYIKFGIDFIPYNILINRDGTIYDKEVNIKFLENKILEIL